MSATELIAPTTTAPVQELETAQLGIEGMHCASCVARIERELQSVPGVHDATVSLAAEEARVRFAPAALGVAQLEQAVERAGYTAHAKAEVATEDEFARQDRDRTREYRVLMGKFWFSAAVAVPVLLLSNTMLVPGLKDVSWLEKGSDGLYWVWRGLAVLTLPVQRGEQRWRPARASASSGACAWRASTTPPPSWAFSPARLRSRRAGSRDPVRHRLRRPGSARGGDRAGRRAVRDPVPQRWRCALLPGLRPVTGAMFQTGST